MAKKKVVKANPDSSNAVASQAGYIKNVLIGEIGAVHKTSPYLSFTLMSEGIKFLGVCVNRLKSPHDLPLSDRGSVGCFIYAIKKLNAFKEYRKKTGVFKNYPLMLASVPCKGIALTNGNPRSHLKKDGNKQLVINCESFYASFKQACLEVINLMAESQNKKGSKQSKDVLVIATGKRSNKKVS